MYPFAIAQKYQILLLEVGNNLQHLIEQFLEFSIFPIHPFQRHNINLKPLIFPNSRIWQLSGERANHFVTDRKLERSIESNENSFLRAGRQAGQRPVPITGYPLTRDVLSVIESASLASLTDLHQSSLLPHDNRIRDAPLQIDWSIRFSYTSFVGFAWKFSILSYVSTHTHIHTLCRRAPMAIQEQSNGH